MQLRGKDVREAVTKAKEYQNTFAAEHGGSAPINGLARGILDGNGVAYDQDTTKQQGYDAVDSIYKAKPKVNMTI